MSVTVTRHQKYIIVFKNIFLIFFYSLKKQCHAIFDPHFFTIPTHLGHSSYAEVFLHMVTVSWRYSHMQKSPTAPVAGGCNAALGGQGQSGCMRPICCRSSSKLWISVRAQGCCYAVLAGPG